MGEQSKGNPACVRSSSSISDNNDPYYIFYQEITHSANNKTEKHPEKIDDKFFY